MNIYFFFIYNMTKYLIRDYDFVGFEISKNSRKKYDAIIKKRDTHAQKNGETIRIPFGARGMDQYKDQTGLDEYSRFDHLDEARRLSFQKRFQRNYDPGYYSPLYFSWNYLW